MSLQNVSTLKSVTFRSTFDTFEQQGQQNESPVQQHHQQQCQPCCSDVLNVLREGDPLRVETWWSDV